ncbi:MAG: hypothetical protein IH609_20665, partial [Dehalococcoidia bacterium]|nr:hypothetical protein [Dehalococcoidia bacterium]
GYGEGDVVPGSYDSLLAKVISHGADRNEAIRRAIEDIEAFEIRGVPTNLAFAGRIIGHDDFRSGGGTVDWLEREMEGLLAPRVPARHWAAAAAALAAAKSRRARGPWGAARWIGAGGAVCWLSSGPERCRAEVRGAGPAFEVDIDGETLTVTPLGEQEGEAAYRVGGGRETVVVTALPFSSGADLSVREPARDTVDAVTQVRAMPPPALPRRAHAAAEGVFAVTAPLSGTVAAVQVAVGDVVEVGQLVVVLEAMKMEHRIVASESGTVREVLVAAGDVVREGDVLAEVE